MKLLLDENIPLILQSKLIDKYPLSQSINLLNLSGTADSEIFLYANQHGLTLVTMDTDFSNLITYPLQQTLGRVILRFRQLTILEIVNKTLQAFEAIDSHKIKEKIVIISNKKIRIRGIESL